jgi:hypothetical protein
MPYLDVPEPPAFELWKPYGSDREEGWGDADATTDPQPEVDEPAAEAMHSLLLEPHMRPYRKAIVDHWYLGHRVNRERLEAAHVAIMDTINRWSGLELQSA